MKTLVLTDSELDTIMAGLGKLKKAVQDRIKYNERFRGLEESPKISMGGGNNLLLKAKANVRHRNHNEKRLKEIENLIVSINEQRSQSQDCVM